MPITPVTQDRSVRVAPAPAENITELVGYTPILHLRKISPAGGAQIYAKLEFLNPGGSVKDRAALGMVEDAERRGWLKPGSTIVEATAGNTGVGLALIGVNRGYRVVLFVPEGFAEEKCILMRGFGAEVIRTPEDEAMSGAIRRAIAYAKEHGAWKAMQFENPANPDFHARTITQAGHDFQRLRLERTLWETCRVPSAPSFGVRTGGETIVVSCQPLNTSPASFEHAVTHPRSNA